MHYTRVVSPHEEPTPVFRRDRAYRGNPYWNVAQSIHQEIGPQLRSIRLPAPRTWNALWGPVVNAASIDWTYAIRAFRAPGPARPCLGRSFPFPTSTSYCTIPAKSLFQRSFRDKARLRGAGPMEFAAALTDRGRPPARP